MTELDLEIPGLAEELIDEYGKVVTFAIASEAGTEGGGTYEPGTGTIAGLPDPLAPSLSLKALVEPDKGQAVRAGLAEGADLKLTIAAVSFVNRKPTTSDRVTVDDESYHVVLVKPTYSGELVAIYEIWVSR